jgi:two-component system phosphate regulon sensor histidine kinase PhoR
MAPLMPWLNYIPEVRLFSSTTFSAPLFLDTPASLPYILIVNPITSAILESMSDGVLVFDFHGGIIFSNPAARELLLFGEDEVKSRTYVDFFKSQAEGDALGELLAAWIQNRKIQVCRDISFVRADGRQVELAVTTSFLDPAGLDGQDNGVVVVFRDVTESKALERARQRVIDHLSHELKTPLAIIDATIKRLLQPEVAGLVKRIEQNLRRLQDIQVEAEEIAKENNLRQTKGPALMEQMMDLLDLVAEKNAVCKEPLATAKDEIRQLFPASQGQTEAVSIAAALEAMLGRIPVLAPGRAVTVEKACEGDLTIWIDPGVLDKILMALVKNAFEATPDGGEITISSRLAGGRVQLDIRDTGIGITVESQRQIFGGFYHAKETDLYTTRKPFDFGAGGKGLDLLRLKILSKAYGFEIACDSARCRFIPRECDLCPGDVTCCPHVDDLEQCARAGGTVFTLFFQPY